MMRLKPFSHYNDETIIMMRLKPFSHYNDETIIMMRLKPFSHYSETKTIFTIMMRLKLFFSPMRL
jgi:hypothetical protein